MNEQTYQSIQFMRENLANRFHKIISQLDYPSVGPPFIHSRIPNTSKHWQRHKLSDKFIRKYDLSNCEQFYYTIKSKENKKISSR
ncbi:unnamed protein product [Adineta steineri]|uniref:Uncharacterized protein n=1 Tax=Adineta steineri TaxID=433720 RepID=A0A820FDT6_9BILA|nr:unnamed protein product [Adineta steineri]